MIQTNAAADPLIHAAAIKLANDFTNMVAGILRDDEKGDCRREAYMLARRALEDLVKGDK